MNAPIKTPLISICIPTYNRADLLEYCLENLRALDAFGVDYEVCVLNHASTDHTAQVLAKAQAKWENIRVGTQTKQVSIIGQHTASLRLARGTFIVPMADDDKLRMDVLVGYVRQMQQQPEVAVTYTSYIAYDDEAEKPLHDYFNVPERVSFQQGQTLDLLNFMASRAAYPEIAIYRASTLQAVLFAHQGAGLHNFVWAFELLKRGSVVFQPTPYYLEIAKVKSRFTRPSRLNTELFSHFVDITRAGLEVVMSRIVQAAGGLALVPEMRPRVHEMLLGYLIERLGAAYTRAVGTGDYLIASGLAQRIALWRGAFGAAFDQEVRTLLFGAGVQQAAWMLKEMSWKRELVFCDFQSQQAFVDILNLKYPEIAVRFLSAMQVRESVDPAAALLVVRDGNAKAVFEDRFAAGDILSLEDCIEFNKVCPIQYSLADA